MRRHRGTSFLRDSNGGTTKRCYVSWKSRYADDEVADGTLLFDRCSLNNYTVERRQIIRGSTFNREIKLANIASRRFDEYIIYTSVRTLTLSPPRMDSVNLSVWINAETFVVFGRYSREILVYSSHCHVKLAFHDRVSGVERLN